LNNTAKSGCVEAAIHRPDDGIAIVGEPEVTITGIEPAEIILVDAACRARYYAIVWLR
jgi:hypothetical protein